MVFSFVWQHSDEKKIVRTFYKKNCAIDNTPKRLMFEFESIVIIFPLTQTLKMELFFRTSLVHKLYDFLIIKFRLEYINAIIIKRMILCIQKKRTP